jgi:hypothetical protein
MRTCLLLIVSVLVPASAISQQARPEGKTKSAEVFKQLSALVGEWEGNQDSVPIKVTYTLTGDGSALMEYMKPGDSPTGAMITMFTVDGDHLIATHYCAAGNQPQMVTGIPGTLEQGVNFSLVRVTGMKTPDDFHNTGLTFIQDDKDHITQRWTYSYKGKTGTNVFHYARKGL